MGIEQQEYRQRQQEIMSKIGGGTAIFRSAPMATMHNDVEYTYRQESSFYYLTGFNEPEAVAVFAPHHPEHQYILFVQPKDPERETWTGYRCGVEAAKEIYGADEAYPIQELNQKLPQYLVDADRIYYHLGNDESFNNIIVSHWQKLMRGYQRNGTAPLAIEDTRPLTFPMRLVKSPGEIAMMRRAMEISAMAHNRAREFAEPGIYEYQVQAEIEHIFRKEGGMGIAYPSIVASGENACILHYIENERQIQENELLLIDAGCSYGYYNSDITRTFPVSGKFTAEQKALYEIVLEAQLQAIAEVQPGKPYNDFHDMAVCVIVQGLLDLGLLRGNLEEIIEEEKYKPFYMHRTGHWLGLDVHDVGIYKSDRKTWQNLQPGHILTVEPGIYISPFIKAAEGQPEIPDRWKGIGIRIEDDLLVTKEGHDILTADVPKSVADMER
ncbi:aminopeptidase P N-terminal domain-containing protein [Waterburya agarophytonicola K14]|uniref:Xaa-Pro aminopeptidase n=1 Tax=Waterburya agarophytonicola KI4 TaxID=2874699 RepID=A0A964FGV6_9CYAN|nr:aminopeptidase P N-terminal domain-containing protein [Waterburya agarophytonicola]MCC0176878.1 aminopeptidase P N-terminal domain-containing protein [Waterburya agarophytonicola KI4]